MDLRDQNGFTDGRPPSVQVQMGILNPMVRPIFSSSYIVFHGSFQVI